VEDELEDEFEDEELLMMEEMYGIEFWK